MKKLLVAIGFVALLVFGGRALMQFMHGSANENAASTRVERFLSGLRDGGDFQDAFAMWRTGDSGGMRELTQDQYNAEVETLNTWLAGAGVGPKVRRYEIQRTRLVSSQESAGGARVKVTCLIDGNRKAILVVRSAPLEWTAPDPAGAGAVD